ncbi:hypothetical protein ACJX0J_022130, partial [Zea mays]
MDGVVEAHPIAQAWRQSGLLMTILTQDTIKGLKDLKFPAVVEKLPSWPHIDQSIFLVPVSQSGFNVGPVNCYCTFLAKHTVVVVHAQKEINKRFPHLNLY